MGVFIQSLKNINQQELMHVNFRKTSFIWVNTANASQIKVT